MTDLMSIARLSLLCLLLAAGPALAEKSDLLAVPPAPEEAMAEPIPNAEPPASPEAPPPAGKKPAARPEPAKPKSFAEDVCGIISREAKRRGLPETFFARLIWRESTFDPDAVSPKGAQGIAQFMPGTAADRGLADPFAPREALPASASLLADLKRDLGNLGLAAAGYNAGAEAVSGWIAGRRSLPLETQEYVAFITGRTAEEWMERGADHAIPALGKAEGSFAADCVRLVKRELAPRSTARATGSGGVGRGAWKPWGVVLSGGFNEGRAIEAFNRIRKRHPDLLGKVKPMVVRKKNASRGRTRMVSVMAGHDERAAADALCDKLQAKGAACIVLKNVK